jgi:hypothetical protein
MGVRFKRKNNNTEIDKLSSPGLIFLLYCIVSSRIMLYGRVNGLWPLKLFYWIKKGSK